AAWCSAPAGWAAPSRCTLPPTTAPGRPGSSSRCHTVRTCWAWTCCAGCWRPGGPGRRSPSSKTRSATPWCLPSSAWWWCRSCTGPGPSPALPSRLRYPWPPPTSSIRSGPGMTAERAAGPGPVQAGAPREELSRAGSKRFPMLRWLLLALVLTLASCAAPGAGEAPEPAQLDGTIVTPGAEDPEEQVPVVRIAVVTRLNDEAERGTRLALEQREGRVAGMPVEIATLAGPSSLTALAQEVEGLISAGRIHGLVVDL